MFDNNDQNQQAAATTAPVPADSSAPAVDATTAPAAPTADTSAPAMPAADQSFNATPLTTDPVSTPAAPTADTSAPAMPADISMPSVDPVSSTDVSAPAPADMGVSTDITPVITPDSPAPAASSTDNGGGDLLSIKQDALQSLSPLLSQLDQSPEEKFRTTMMLIQASDDQSLIQSAYAAAKEITDEKVRAQALLDIVNEINYFTQSSKPAA